jgi:hypothetical protein
MATTQSTSCIAFDGAKLIAEGELMDVAAKTKRMLDRGSDAAVLIFNAATSEPIDVDFRGTVDDVLSRIPAAMETAEFGPETPRGPGRPKLGVVAREVTLLPRHWEWLNRQRGGASVALRKLVDDARHANEGKDRARAAQEAAYRFMSAMAGDREGFEEASRALFASDTTRFDRIIAAWPKDIRTHTQKLAAASMQQRQNDASAGGGDNLPLGV